MFTKESAVDMMAARMPANTSPAFTAYDDNGLYFRTAPSDVVQGAALADLLIADGNADLSKALGLDFDGSGIGFGVRAQRFAAIVEDGVVTKLAVEEPMKFEVSSAEAILDAL